MAATAKKKIDAPWSHQIIQGFLAGAYVGVGALSANLAEAGFPNKEVSSLLGGAVFPIGLIAIFMTGANLFTGNCMYVVPSLLSHKVAPLRALCYLCISWITNFCGALFVSFFLGHLAKYFHSPPYSTFVIANADKKCKLEWGVAFLRGIGANWLVCLGWWQALSTDDTIGKIFSIWWPVATFTAIGFEHCVANMFYVTIGLFEGASSDVGDFLVHNLVPVTLGNFVGGSVLLGLATYATFDSKSPLAVVPKEVHAEHTQPLTCSATNVEAGASMRAW